MKLALILILLTAGVASGQRLIVNPYVTPPEISYGIISWWKAETITNLVDNTPVVFWRDSSPTTTNAVPISGPTTPYYRTSVLGGLPALATTNGVDTELRFLPAQLSNSFTVIWVGRVFAFPGFGGVFSFRPANSFGFGMPCDGAQFNPHLVVVNAAGTETLNKKTVTPLTIPMTAPGQIAWTFDGTTAHAYTNGVEATIADGTAGFSIAYASIGRAYAPTTSYHGEIQVYPYVLDSTKLTDIYNRLKSKWGTL